jgi:hypothetical protein
VWPALDLVHTKTRRTDTTTIFAKRLYLGKSEHKQSL